jgi:hypothetical protein
VLRVQREREVRRGAGERADEALDRGLLDVVTATVEVAIVVAVVVAVIAVPDVVDCVFTCTKALSRSPPIRSMRVFMSVVNDAPCTVNVWLGAAPARFSTRPLISNVCPMGEACSASMNVACRMPFASKLPLSSSTLPTSRLSSVRPECVNERSKWVLASTSTGTVSTSNVAPAVALGLAVMGPSRSSMNSTLDARVLSFLSQ